MLENNFKINVLFFSSNRKFFLICLANQEQRIDRRNYRKIGNIDAVVFFAIRQINLPNANKVAGILDKIMIILSYVIPMFKNKLHIP